MSSAYTDHHLPLDPESRFIRVFDLQPSHFGTEEEPIRGHLRVVCLDNNPSYAAISYAWRTTLPSGHIADEPSLHIACGADESLPVTANCYDALQQLRLSFRTRTLWVDSICVDQSNKKERSHQVLLMRDIYSQAQKVYIWLGKGTQDSDDAMDWLADATLDVSPLTLIRISAFPEFLVRRRDIARICRMFLEQIRVSVHRWRPKKLKISYNSDAMKDLISRAWFKRIWTIQELVMAREPIVVCGEKSIRWSNLHWGIWAATKFADDEDSGALSDICDSVLVTEALWLDHHIISEWSESPIKKRLLRGARPESSAFRRRLLEFISDHGWTLVYIQMFGIFLAILTRMYYGLRPLNSLGLLLPILSCIATLVLTPAGLFKDHEQSVRRKIVNILNRTRTRQATEGVDRVFALYGVLQNLGIPLQKPDYEKSVGEVYSEFTRAIISWHKSLDILTEASTPSLPDTPSWVPNWSTRYHRLFKGDSRAAKDSSPRYSFSDCGRRLETSGMVVGTVVYCTEALEEPSGDLFSGGRDSIDPAFLSRSLHNVRVLTQWISYAFQMSNPNHELFSEAIFETVHTETDFAAKDKPHLRQTFKKWYSVLTADYSECHAICSPDIACALVLSMKESLNRYHNERCRAIAGKRIFFVTSNGYIGTGPPFMLNRDKVAILSGLRSPLILRGVGPDHEVVGAAYVHAIMQGEAWSEDKGELLQVTLI